MNEKSGQNIRSIHQNSYIGILGQVSNCTILSTNYTFSFPCLIQSCRPKIKRNRVLKILTSVSRPSCRYFYAIYRYDTLFFGKYICKQYSLKTYPINMLKPWPKWQASGGVCTTTESCSPFLGSIET